MNTEYSDSQENLPEPVQQTDAVECNPDETPVAESTGATGAPSDT